MSMFSLLADLKAKVESFREFVRQMQVLNSYPTSLIVNADQTPLFLEMPQERTLEMKGARTVHVRTAGYEKERLTIMLAVTASSLKLPPYVVFKRKTIPKVKVPRGDSLLPLRMLFVPMYMRMMCIMRCTSVVIRAQLWGWMDENLVQDWTTQVLVPFMRPLRDEGCSRKDVLLVLDSYQGHLTEAVSQTMRLFRLTRTVIPGGCTPLVQPLDVSINRAFKAGVRHRYGTWFEEDGIRSTTPAGNLKKPPAELVLKWIDEAWADVPEEMVRKAFLTCSISNAEDGSQDHLILAHMRDSGEVEVLEDVMEEEQDELVPNPFYSAPVVTPPDVTVEMEEEAVLAAEVEEADEEAVPAKSDSSDSDDGNANEADEWSDEGDEWWAPGRYEGAEVDEWVAGDDDE
ncbi:unnamed protein product [Closterium sp. NIES-54]